MTLHLPRDDPANKHLAQLKRRCLQNCPDSHDGGSKKDSFLTTNALTNGESANRTEKTANVIDGCHRGEGFGFGWARKIKNVEEVLSDYDTTL